MFAIACTLLILEIKVPHLEDMARPGALWPALLAAWPSFLAFIIRFGSIIVGWANHQRGLNLLVHSSKAFLFANAFLLLTITFIPFPTAVLAAYLNTPQANVAVMFYGAAWTLYQVGFMLWYHSMLRPRSLFHASLPKAQLRKYSILIACSFVVYALTTVIAYWFPTTALVIIAAPFVVWIVTALGTEENALLDTLQREDGN